MADWFAEHGTDDWFATRAPQAPSAPPLPVEQEDPRSGFARAWDVAFTPPAIVTEGAESLKEWALPANSWWRKVAIPGTSVPLSAVGETAIDIGSNLLTPGDVGLALASGGTSLAARAGLKGAATAVKAAQVANRAANVGLVGRGVERLAEAESGADIAAGLVETGFGALGARAGRATPEITPEPTVRPTAPIEAAAPSLAPHERALLEQFRTDLVELPPLRGRQLREGGFAHGAGGAPILEQMRILSGQNVRYQKYVNAIDDLLSGKPPKTALHKAALESVRGHLAKEEGFVAPMTRDLGRRAAETVEDEGFDAFASGIEDVVNRTRGSDIEALGGLGEAGFATPPFMLHAAGGLTGAAYGAATGEDTEDRIRRALLYGGMGAAAPSLLKRGEAPPSGARAPGIVETRATGKTARVPRVEDVGAPIKEPLKDTEAFLGKFEPEVRAGILERLEANQGFQAQRRGTLSAARTAEIADRIAVDVARVTPPGTTASAEVITAYTRAVRQTQEKVNALASKVSSGQASDADILALEAAKQEAATALQSVMGMRAEAGRSLASFRFLDNILNSGDSSLITSTADRLRGEARQFAEEFATVGADPLKQYEWLKGKTTAKTFGEKLRGYYYANILSGPKTHARNIVGNVASIISHTAAQPFAAGIDVARSAVSGAPRSVRFSELPHGVVGAAAGMEEGIREFLYTMKHGISQRGLSTSIAQAEKGILDLPRVEFAGGGANPFNWPGRGLDATDQFFRSVARQSEIYSAAYTAARNEGHTGQKLLDRMAELRSDGGEVGKNLREGAERTAARQVFQQESGPITQWLAQGYSKPYVGKAMMFTMPFLRTPANIVREGFQYTPAGFASKAAKAGGREGAQAMGKAAAGSAALGGLAWLASTGRLSGNGPSDPGERARLMETGWRPNSVKMGDEWVSYQLMQPIAVPASLIANGFEAWREKDGSEKGAIDLAVSIASRTANSFLDQSFLSGVFDLFEGLKDPDRSGSRVAGRMAQGLIPFVGAVRSARDLTDPVVRKPGGFVEEVQAGVPGYSQAIEPRLNTYGEPITRPGGPLRRALDPFNVSPTVSDPVAAELSRLGVNPTQLGDSLTVRNRKLELTNEESLALRQEQGRMMRQVLERVMRASRYERLNDEQRQALLKRAMSAAREQVNTAAKVKVLRRERREGRTR